MELKEIINQDTTTIVDVREPYEYAMGHANGSLNIPLGSLPQRINEFMKLPQPIVVYCRSGMRSAQAMGILRALGIREVYNGGGLEEVIYYQNQKTLSNN